MMLEAGDVTVTVDPARGGRVASLRVDDLELLVGPDEVGADPILWGCYPMVPWAGRVREGRFRFGDEDHVLPLGLPPHAIHGVGHGSAWEASGPDTLRLDLGDGWPFGGEVSQRFELTDGRLALTMTVTAGDAAMPVVAGWHPCFRRQLPRGDPARPVIDAASMWERDAAGIPTGRRVPVPPGPWDDAFADVRADPRVTWPGALDLSLRSDCPVWVVYDQDPRMVCVEPQTDAPDAFNREAEVLEPGSSRRLRLEIGWEVEGRPLESSEGTT